MEEIYYCISKYRRIVRLIEQEAISIRKCMSGDLLDIYLCILDEEKAQMESAIRSMKTLI